MKRRSYQFIVWLLLGLSGCDTSPDYADLQTFIDKAKAQSSGTIERIPKGQPYKSFTYDAAALRSPFQPIVQLESNLGSKVNTSAVQPNQARTKHLLEGFAIESLVMVGVLSNRRASYALLRSSNGVHRVALGDYLGINNGRVTTITASQVEVIEIIADGEGGWREQPYTLLLQERE